MFMWNIVMLMGGFLCRGMGCAGVQEGCGHGEYAHREDEKDRGVCLEVAHSYLQQYCKYRGLGGNVQMWGEGGN